MIADSAMVYLSDYLVLAHMAAKCTKALRQVVRACRLICHNGLPAVYLGRAV